jgi:hypothetical protein
MKTPEDFAAWKKAALQELAAAQYNEIEALREERDLALAAWRLEVEMAAVTLFGQVGPTQ